MDFKDILCNYNRIVIAGGTGTGKSTLASACQDRLVIQTDDYQHLAWKDVPQAILDAVKDQSRYLIEGIHVPRVLRKGLTADAVIWLSVSYKPLTAKQEQFNKGLLTTFEDWLSNNTKANVIYL